MVLFRRFHGVPFALVVALVACVAASPAGAELRDNGDGTITDPATALTWVADPAFAEEVGVGAWAPRSEAIALVRAMNAGEVENFGRTDWRLPTARERASLDTTAPGSGLRRRTAALRVGPELVEVRPVSGSALVAGIADAAVVAIHGVLLSRNVEVVGDVVANEGGGPTLAAGWEVQIDRDARVDGDVAGDRVRLDRGVTVTGTVASNQLSAGKATIGSTSSPLGLPVFSMLPPLAVSLPRGEAPAVAVEVAPGETLELPAEDYADVTVAGGGTLVLTGGVYQIAGLDLDTGARLLVRAASDVRLRDRLRAGSNVEVGPEAGSGLDGSATIFSVGGIDGADGVLGSLPRAVEIGARSTFHANLHAPDGSVRFGQQIAFEGAIIAGQVQVDRLGELVLASYWGNRAPIAESQTVTLSGSASIAITLTGSDPEGGDLTFSIVDPPDHGTLTAPVPIVPAPVAGRDGGPAVQPPVTSASVTYTPSGAGDEVDSFVFQVADPLGSFGTAVVVLQPPVPEAPPPPPPATVVAGNLNATVHSDATGILGFTAGAPDGVALTYSLIAGSGPANGVLGSIVASPLVPSRTASAEYTPAPGFVGLDSFDFEVCGTVAAVLVCDQATYTIEVVSPPVETVGELAVDRELTAVEGVPLLLDLLSGFTLNQPAASSIAGTVRVVTAEAVGIQSAAVGGNVSDANGDGFGDGANALPGPVPGLVSAGVGQTGGAGSNGTVRVHIEYDVSGFATFIDQVVSAQVQLTTNRGTVDQLQTDFYSIVGDGDGILDASDFESLGVGFGVSMPVPPTQAVGEDGSFSFSVLGALQAALAGGQDYLVVQGRVVETITFPARGLQVYSTADGNLTSFKAPALTFSTPPPTPLEVTITSLPQFGTLLTTGGQPINSVPFILGGSKLQYVPGPGFTGTDSFGYEVSNFSESGAGVVTIVVLPRDCGNFAVDCEDGR
jgi:hypothetical protein